MKTITKIQQSITRAQLEALQVELKEYHLSDKSARRIEAAFKEKRKEINRLEASNRMKALNAKRRQEKHKIAA